MKTPKALLSILPIFIVVACGSSEKRSSVRCHPIGKSVSCQCADGRHGAAVCRSNGSLSECACTGESGGAAGDDGSGGVTSGASGTGPSGGNGGGARGGAGGQSGGTGGARGGTGGDGGTGDGGDPAEGGEAGRGDGGAPTGGTGGGTGGACGPADVAGCRCPDDALGYRLCVAGAFGPCTCDGGTGGSAGTGGFGTCQPVDEICDQMDNDCDGIADNGFPCPDSSVHNTSPFRGGAYFQGTLGELSTGDDALQQFWPTLSDDYVTGFDSYADDYRFSRLDGTVFYNATFSGIFRNGMSETADDDILVSPVPCDDFYMTDFDLDATGTLYYACQGVLYRGATEIVAGTFSSIAGVLDDGRIVLVRGGQFAVLNAQGRELSRFPPPNFFTGQVSTISAATTIQDNRAYVALTRRYLPDEREMLVYRIDPDSTFRFVRRTPASYNGLYALVLSDGTIFQRVSSSLDDDRSGASKTTAV